MTGWLAFVFIFLTGADIATTLYALSRGGAVELNPHAARGDGIRVGFLIISNAMLMLPLLIAFGFGAAHAAKVPPPVLARWWRHILDIFFIHPLNDAARTRSPLRLVTAAMTLLVLKSVILLSNVLVIAGKDNPVSLLAKFWTIVGLDGAPRYWAAYAVLIVPCYIGGVGLAAMCLRSIQRASAAAGYPTTVQTQSS